MALIGADLDLQQMRAALEGQGRKLVRSERALAEAPLEETYYVEPASSAEPALVEPTAAVGPGSEGAIALRASLDRLAASPHLDVLLKGERGSGRRTLARELHERTLRTGKWAEPVDEAELEAVLATDEPGTVYLGDLVRISKLQQMKLYRALSGRRLGSRRRFVGALELDAPAARGGELCEWVVDRFAVTLRVPPLCERSAELPEIARQMLACLARELKLDCPELSSEAIEVLRQHRFPGNLRELENVLRSTLIASKGAKLGARDLCIQLPNEKAPFTLPSDGIDLDALERDMIQQALRRAQGNQTRAASLLGLTRDQVRYRLSKITELADK